MCPVFLSSGQGLHECGCLRKSAEEGSKAFSAFQSLQGRFGNDITRRILSERAEPDALEHWYNVMQGRAGEAIIGGLAFQLLFLF